MKLTEEQKYSIINNCETVEDLENAIIGISDHGTIEGKSRSFDAIKMSSYVKAVVNGELIPNVLTRSYGIRQQALYIKYYLTLSEYMLNFMIPENE